MGVQGLWKLLAPAGRRIKLDVLENRVLAIDVSIWLLKMIHGYLALGSAEHRNIHLIGIFRRIVKLLYYGIKPVFVFDGKFPELKRETVRKRQEFRENRKTNLKKVAEKFLSKVLEDRLKETVGRLMQPKKPLSSPKKGKGYNSFDKDYFDQEEDEDKMFNDDTQVFDYEFDYIVDENKELLMADGIDLEEFYLQDSEAQYDTIKRVKNKMRDRKIKKYLEIDSLDDLSKVHVRDYVSHIQRKNKIEKTREEACARRLTEEQELVIGNSKYKDMFTSNYMKTFFADPKKQVVHGTLASDRTKGYMYMTQTNDKYDAEVLKFDKKRGSKNEKLKRLSAQLREIAQHAENIPQFFSFEELLCDNPIEAFKHSNLTAKPESPTKKASQIRTFIQESDRKLHEEIKTNVDVDEVFGFDDWEKKEETVNNQELKDDEKKCGIFDQEDANSNLEDLFEFNLEDYTKKPTESAIDKVEEVVKVEDKKENIAGNEDNFPMSQNSGLGLDDIKTKIAKLKEEMMEENLEKAKQSQHKEAIIDNDSPRVRKKVVKPESKVKTQREREFETKVALESMEETYYEPETEQVEDSTKSRDNKATKAENNKEMQTVAALEKKSIDELSDIRQKDQAIVESDDELKSVSSTKQRKNESQLGIEINKGQDKAEEKKQEEDGNNNKQAEWFKRLIQEDDNGLPEVEEAEEEEIGEITMSKDKEKDQKNRTSELEELNGFRPDYMEEFDMMDLDEEKLVQEMKELEDAENLDKWTLMQEFQKFQNLSEFEAGSIQEKFNEIKELLSLFGIPWVDSPTEAEAQCSFLEENGLVDGIITDDSDVFLFGGKHVYRNIFEKGDYAHAYRMNYVEHDMALDRNKLILLALFLGSDYTLGIRGVGIVNAIEIVTAFDTVEALKRFKEWAEVPDVLLENASEHYRNVPQKELDYKLYHRNFKKHWELPENFPDERVIDAYKHPNVDQSLEKFQWGQPDFNSLTKFCETRLKWDEARIFNLLEPLKKAMSERSDQTKITDYFKEEKIATINSKRITDAIKNLRTKGNDDFHLPATITKSIDNIIEKQNPRNIKKRETGDYANEMAKHFAFDKKRVKKQS